MTIINTLPVKSLPTKDTPGLRKEAEPEVNTGFLLMFQAIQGENQAENSQTSSNQLLTKEALLNPDLNKLVGEIPEETLDELNQLIGKAIHQIITERNVSPEAKTISLIAFSLQSKEQTQLDSKNNPSSINLNAALTKEILRDFDGTLPKDTLKYLDSTKLKEILKHIEALQLIDNGKNKSSTSGSVFTRGIITIPSDPTLRPLDNGKIPNLNIANLNLTNNRPIIIEGHSYGEVKLDKATPTIQINTTDSPEQTQQKFLDQLQTILKSTRFSHVAKNLSQMTIQLRPDNLGFMTIKVEQVNQEMIARIITSTSTAKELIESNLHQLRHLNIQVDKFEVNTQQANQQLKEQEQSNQQQKKEQNKDKGDNEQASQSFEEQLENILP